MITTTFCYTIALPVGYALTLLALDYRPGVVHALLFGAHAGLGAWINYYDTMLPFYSAITFMVPTLLSNIVWHLWLEGNWPGFQPFEAFFTTPLLLMLYLLASASEPQAIAVFFLERLRDVAALI